MSNRGVGLPDPCFRMAPFPNRHVAQGRMLLSKEVNAPRSLANARTSGDAKPRQLEPKRAVRHYFCAHEFHHI